MADVRSDGMSLCTYTLVQQRRGTCARVFPFSHLFSSLVAQKYINVFIMYINVCKHIRSTAIQHKYTHTFLPTHDIHTQLVCALWRRNTQKYCVLCANTHSYTVFT